MIIAPLLVNVYPKHIHAVCKCIRQLVIHKTLRMLHPWSSSGGKPGKREVGTPSMPSLSSALAEPCFSKDAVNLSGVLPEQYGAAVQRDTCTEMMPDT